jgi:uncharacterized protein (TIGR01777 family)
MHIVLTGGTGFVGTHLCRACLEAGHEVTAIGSRPAFDRIVHPRLHYLSADTTRPGPWQARIASADRIYNLAGRTIFKRWTSGYKQQIHDSRILTTRNLVAALPATTAATLVSVSAVGYYGSCGDTELTEEAPAGGDFLAALAQDWETEALQAVAKGARVVNARLGIVLGTDGGALAKMVPAFRSFMGGPLGTGRQWFPWIHIRDLVAALEFLGRRVDLKGPFNLCAPQAVTNGQMAVALGRALNRPARLAVPAFMLKLSMGSELADVLLGSQRTLPAKLLAAGFAFGFDRIEAALADLFGKEPQIE